jgi:hypothetical protein
MKDHFRRYRRQSCCMAGRTEGRGGGASCFPNGRWASMVSGGGWAPQVLVLPVARGWNMCDPAKLPEGSPRGRAPAATSSSTCASPGASSARCACSAVSVATPRLTTSSSPVRLVSMPVLFGATGMVPPAWPVNYLMWGCSSTTSCTGGTRGGGRGITTCFPPASRTWASCRTPCCSLAASTAATAP